MFQHLVQQRQPRIATGHVAQHASLQTCAPKGGEVVLQGRLIGGSAVEISPRLRAHALPRVWQVIVHRHHAGRNRIQWWQDRAHGCTKRTRSSAAKASSISTSAAEGGASG